MGNHLTTSDEILASARALITNGGYNGFSYADIAGVVEIRKASIHHHFPNKVDLVRTLVVQYREEAEAGLSGMEQSIRDPLQILKAYAGYWSACIADASRPFCVCAMLASELPALPPEVAAEVTAYFRFMSTWLTSVMERGAREGGLNLSGEPRVEAEAFLASIHGAMLSARAYGMPEVFVAILEPTLKRLAPSVAD